MPSSSLRVGDLPPSSYADAVGVLARGMRDNPIHLAAYGPDPDRREQAHARMIRALFRHGRKNEPIGPLAVDRDLQGQGIGSVLLAEHCRRLDERGEVGYLETDKPENVRFYEKQGYRVIGEAPALGVPSWFMRRARASEPRPSP